MNFTHIHKTKGTFYNSSKRTELTIIIMAHSMNKKMSGDTTLGEDVSASSSFAGSDIYRDEETASVSSTNKTEESEEKLNVAKRETLAVFRLRLLVVAVLLLAALAVSLIVYIVTDQAEQDEYKHQFDAASNKVLDSFMDIFSSKLQAISSLGVALTANGEGVSMQKRSSLFVPYFCLKC